ncbi:MAG: hypothetical protein JRH20_02410 [Deltaproteobacteria bacterium]|nr:hypothetical protein [Deltaproteobacteria bacterium]
MSSNLILKSLPVVLTLLLGSPLAHAQTSQELKQARAAWKAGRSLFGKGDYRAAKVKFQEGFRLSKKSGFLHNMAECARMGGSKPEARQLYMRYLREYPTGKHRHEALMRCQALKAGPCVVVDKPATTGAEHPKKAEPDLAPSDPGAAKGFLPPSSNPAESAPGDEKTSSTAWYKHWGFWTAVGAVVVAGTVTTVALASSSGDAAIPAGDSLLDFRK